MFDANKIIAALSSELPKVMGTLKTDGAAAVDSVKAGGNAQTVALGAGAAGLLGGLLLSGSGKFGKQLATMGGLAALGTLAYNAWQKHQGAAQAAPVPGSVFLPPATDAGGADPTIGKAIIRAMVAATKADGVIDADEKAKLFDRLGQLELSPEEKAFVFDEMGKPLNIDEVVAPVTSQEMALQIYTASMVAMVPDQPAEKAYLATLAQKLHLDPALVATLHTEAAQPA